MKNPCFFQNKSLDYNVIRTISTAVYGGADLGECLEACSNIKEGDDESWYTAWNQLAENVEKRAHGAKAKRRLQSAESEFRKAANYYRQAGFFLHTNPSDPRILQCSRKSRVCFTEAALLGEYPFQEVQIPYEQTRLPGYLFFATANREKRPLIIINQGFDATAEESFFYVGEEALKRGFHVLLLEGPGQGKALKEQNLHFRFDWEKVITPVVDFTLQLPRVDHDRIVLYGLSFGGYLVPRALAFEKRIKLGIANGGVMNFHMVAIGGDAEVDKQLDNPQAIVEINGEMKKIMKTDVGLRWFFSHGMYAFGAETPVELMKRTRSYHLEDVVDKITTEMLIVDSEDDTEFKGQATELYDKLQSPKTFLMFKSADGAGRHCQIGASVLSNEQILDWIAERL